MSGALIWCPFADADSARTIVSALLDEKLIACANLVPVHAMYTWDGERGEADECAALMKTDASLLEQAVTRLEALHPYDSPAITGWRCDATGAATRDWLGGLAAMRDEA